MLTLAFSPCPNDTFIFDALVNKKIDTDGLEFEIFLEDVQTLNEWALQEKIDFTKISYGVLPLILKNYKVLQSGGALGKGVGPLLVCKQEIKHSKLNIQNFEIAIPGKNTTAHLLFSLAYPNALNKKFMVFNEIEEYVVKNKNALGVIIHESRFTYQEKGLHKVLDLGEYWENTIRQHIPLGGIVAHKRINNDISLKVDALIKKSIEFAFQNYPQITEYVKLHSQEMEENIMKQHIDLYVNNFSLELGVEGRKAVKKLLEIYIQQNPSSEIDFENIF